MVVRVIESRMRWGSILKKKNLVAGFADRCPQISNILGDSFADVNEACNYADYTVSVVHNYLFFLEKCIGQPVVRMYVMLKTLSLDTVWSRKHSMLISIGVGYLFTSCY